MSMDTTRIYCTKCNYEYFENYQPIEIKCRVDNAVVEYWHTKTWCHKCNSIAAAESLPTIEEIREQYEEWCGVPGPPVKGIRAIMRRFDRNYQENLLELSRKIAWREQRLTPPRCLECGSTNIEILKFSPVNDSAVAVANIRHSCGGEMIHDLTGKTDCRFNFKTREIWVDIEGNVVG